MENIENLKIMKPTFAIHTQVEDPSSKTGFRRLSYEWINVFDEHQCGELEEFVEEINNRFPTVKMFAQRGEVSDEEIAHAKYDVEESVQDKTLEPSEESSKSV